MAKVEQSWEPGTLDRTRKNIGVLTEEEAKRMTKILGGEILQEKSAPVDYKALPNYQVYAKKAVGKSANSGSQSSASIQTTVEKKQEFKLPNINSKENQLFEKLMMDDEYKIKTSYGLFNFVLKFTKGQNYLRKSFVEYTLKKDIEHLEEFIISIKTIIQLAPESYKDVFIQDNDTLENKYLFMKLVGCWSLKDVKYYYNALQTHPESVSVLATKDFIKSIYKLLLKIYYLGENKIPDLIKEVYADLVKYPRIDKKRLSDVSKKSITEWFYVYSKVIKGLYPLLMRLCSKHFDYFQDFFLTRTADILGFLEMTKYDLMLPNRKVKKIEEEEVSESKEKKEEKRTTIDLSYVSTGLKLLEKLFPTAGFLRLQEYPDMFPYFQPLYQLREGYNLLSPENPLQITITLLRISEDLLQGCRNIVFTDEAEFYFGEKEEDKLSVILSEWTLYREILFEKNYGDQIREFVNHEYSNPGEFRKSQYGLKLQTQMLWQTQFYFLPYFKFQQLILDKPKNDNTYKPLCIRTTQMKKLLSSLVKKMEAAEKSKGKVAGIANPWEKYHFDIQTPISKRLNVILGAKKSPEETKATNANLLKYALCVISVLDWWLNERSSPAYSADSSKIYRISPKDNAPEFSVPLITNQDKLFTDALKATTQNVAQTTTQNVEQTATQNTEQNTTQETEN